MLSPERHHNRKHRDVGEPFGSCRVCLVDQRTCERKLEYATWQEVDAQVRALNEGRMFQGRCVVRYLCRWCRKWHTKTAVDVRDRAWVARQRERWLERRRLIAGWYWDREIEPDLQRDGMPDEGLAHLRRQYVDSAVWNPEVMEVLYDYHTSTLEDSSGARA